MNLWKINFLHKYQVSVRHCIYKVTSKLLRMFICSLKSGVIIGRLDCCVLLRKLFTNVAKQDCEGAS